MSSALRLRYNTAKAGIVTDPRGWATSAGYEFWYVSGNSDQVGAIAAANDGLDGYGWICTSLGVTEGVNADLISAADRSNPSWTTFNGASDRLSSPRIFGSYAHALQAARFLGYLPTKLTLEFAGRWLGATANETTTFIGMAGPAVTDASAAGCAGAIRSGGTASTFFLTSDNGSDAGANIDNAIHDWKIVYGATTTEWFIDGASQGTITTEADIWPQSFNVFLTSGTNTVDLIAVRIFYS